MAKGEKQHFISGKKVKNRHFNWLIKKILTIVVRIKKKCTFAALKLSTIYKQKKTKKLC